MSTSFTPPLRTRWEEAYLAFETPEEEVKKFRSRLRRMGVERWDRTAQVLELCSGRGSGLRAWHSFGFNRVFGIDYSYAQIVAHDGPGVSLLGDVRSLPFANKSFDIAIVQGGLHHLDSAADVATTLKEMHRVVRSEGRIIIVEPWLTPFLHSVHWACDRKIIRRLWPKLDALAVMTEEESMTYFRWLTNPDELLNLITSYVTPEFLERRWGKLMIVGAPFSAKRYAR
jgi:ubiquinone/menaquinone biosynthesis C-methylase UbiE